MVVAEEHSGSTRICRWMARLLATRSVSPSRAVSPCCRTSALVIDTDSGGGTQDHEIAGLELGAGCGVQNPAVGEIVFGSGHLDRREHRLVPADPLVTHGVQHRLAPAEHDEGVP